MARRNYYDYGDTYSEFHRKEDGIYMVDIDTVETDKETKEPLMVAETRKNIGDPFKKNFRTTQIVASKLNITGNLILFDSSVPKEVIAEKIKMEEYIKNVKKNFERNTGFNPDTMDEITAIYKRQIYPNVEDDFIKMTPREYYDYLHSFHRKAQQTEPKV